MKNIFLFLWCVIKVTSEMYFKLGFLNGFPNILYNLIILLKLVYIQPVRHENKLV